MIDGSRMRIVEVSAGDAAPDLSAEPAIAPLPQDVLARHNPDLLVLAMRDRRLLARCSIWSTQTPRLDDRLIGVVGHYAAADAPAGVSVLQHALERLRQAGLAQVVGPMDGNTWRSYRLVTDPGTEPPFFLEPTNPPNWPQHFVAAGFTPIATYYSALNADLTITDPRIPATLERLQSSGIRIRNIQLDRFDAELSAVHDLSLESFAGNYLYTPIAKEEFLAMYEPIKAHLLPRLVLLAEQGDQLVGFMFGLPDLLEARRGEKVRTAIAKTMAVQPGQAGAGLGSVLMDLFQQSARQLGFTRVIHALMHETNRSRAISSRYGRPIRRYTLFGLGIAE
jgi:GNAT superfamily N-acetyltransferase